MDSNNAVNNTNINTTNANNSRRSACDRCRGHKLRCVRPSDGAFPAEGNGTALPPCERCVKAGAECLHTLRTRRASIRVTGYERPLSSGSLSPTSIYRRPADAHRAAAASDHAFRDPVPRAAFRFPNPAQQPEEGRATVGVRSRSQIGSSHVSRRAREHAASFEASAANAAAAMSGSFPMSMAAAAAAAADSDDAGLEPGISFELASFDPGMQSFHPAPEHYELESDVSLAQLFGHAASAMAGPTRTNAAGARSNAAEVNQDSTVAQPPRSRDECLGQLSALSSRLLKCFSKIEDGPVALEDILAYSTPVNAEPGPCVAKNIIGVLLESSQLFLETLEHLESSAPPQDEQLLLLLRPGSPSNSDYSYVDSPDEVDFLSSESATGTHTPFPASAMHDDANDTDHTAAHFPGAKTHQPPRVPASAATAFSSCHRTHGSFSLPATFTIMTCYMWLLQGYEVVFAAIQDSLLVQKQHQKEQRQPQPQQPHQWQDGPRDDQSQKRSRAPPPPPSAHRSKTTKADTKRPGGPLVLPNIQFGGFGLDGHPNLQIEMLIHVSCQMMERIEAILGIDAMAAGGGDAPAPPPGREHGPLDLRCAPALLHAYLQGAEGGGAESPLPGRSAIVRGMMKTIRQLLNSSHS
ncbi:hypothetical protein LX32DRAFT_651487 [Colletotrichum zoysiae]|uniref:Zn(2)-C6 fungal-type domain-containing protein n=1 Tax=Colletotrichum zoysiae TaxID=1216348 RepID=A0AAD9HLW1_9PEZI|nr:hypothetical protein LX32DRAFT_651487 [Colletotrichum zoysiae]